MPVVGNQRQLLVGSRHRSSTRPGTPPSARTGDRPVHANLGNDARDAGGTGTTSIAPPPPPAASTGRLTTSSPDASPARTPLSARPKPSQRPLELLPQPYTDAEGQGKYGKLTDQILEYFATVGSVDVRARDVAAALGRDTDSGSINTVRSTLDRLVGTSRVS